MIREVDHEVCITVNHVSTQTVNHVPLDRVIVHTEERDNAFIMYQ